MKYPNLLSRTVAIAILLAVFSSHLTAGELKHFKTKIHDVIVREIMGGLEHPWGLDFLPNGSILITERSGDLILLAPGGKSTKVMGTPDVLASGQGGLLDVKVDTDFNTTKKIFLTYSMPDKRSRKAATAVASAFLSYDVKPHIHNLKVIFSQSKPTESGYHFGSRIVITPDNKLFVTIGDRGERDRAQDPFDHAGSIIRINKNGSIPSDNPFFTNKRGLPEIWSIGHRNPQGAVWNPLTQSLWTVAHGAKGGDELNEPQAGRNYGWPVISYGRHYWGGKIGEGTHKYGLEQPVYFWDPSIAPSGLEFYNGNKFPNWHGNLFVGALKYEMIVRLEIRNKTVTGEERLFSSSFGRIRDVKQGPDGYIYFLTDEIDGRLMRVEPNN